MPTEDVTVYGLGGYDPLKPNSNVIDSRIVEVPPAVQNARLIVAKIAQALDQLETADQSWNTLTTAQRLAAAQLAVRVAAKLARLTLNRLDAN